MLWLKCRKRRKNTEHFLNLINIEFKFCQSTSLRQTRLYYVILNYILMFKMDCKALNSFLPLSVWHLNCCNLASALAKLCQPLQLKIKFVISRILSNSAFWFCFKGIMQASATGEVSHCVMCDSHNSVLCVQQGMWKMRSKSSQHACQERKLNCLKERAAIELHCTKLFS